MPAKDRYHDTVKRALVKDGWTIEDDQVRLKIGSRNLWIDLQASRTNQPFAVLIEVKGFENPPSWVEAVSDAIGQYILYSVVLTSKGIAVPLYLAVPTAAYKGIWSEPLGLALIKRLGIKLLVFDPTEEDVLQWLPAPQM